jgi:4-hydroxybenzoate polyprenyltransferase
MVTEPQTQPESLPESLWQTIVRLLRWDKPAGRLILMLPALWATFLAAEGKPPSVLVGIIVLGSIATSAAGCVANDLWDRNIDPQVERTRNRPLASRALSVQVGVAVMAVAFICALVLALYLYQSRNSLTFWLCVAAVPVIVLYPGAKRVFPVPQLVLSIAWGFAVLISWTAVTGVLEPATWVLWGAVVLWTLGFDTVYAMADREDDQRIGIQSSALFFGDRAAESVGCFFLGTTGLLGWLGALMHLYGSFWVTLVLAGGLWLWQYLQLRRPLSRGTYGKIFSQNVLIGFVLLAGMISGAFFSSL